MLNATWIRIHGSIKVWYKDPSDDRPDPEPCIEDPLSRNLVLYYPDGLSYHV